MARMLATRRTELKSAPPQDADPAVQQRVELMSAVRMLNRQSGRIDDRCDDRCDDRDDDWD
jgi:hypothetical protein